MYRISQLMSTPVASSSGSERRYTGELSPTCVFPSFACDFLDGDTSFKCCSVDLLTASHFACRRSPRLLSNGYYTWTEDSFLYDKDGNITLSPPQTSVLYKENLVRIFRKKKRVHRSFSNLFSLRTSKSWLHGNIFGDVDSSLSEDTWLEGVRRLDMEHCSETGFHNLSIADTWDWTILHCGDSDCSLTDAWESEQPNVAPSSSHAMSQIPRQNSHDGALQSHVMASEHFPGNILDRAKASLWQDVSFPAILLAVFLIICACARWFLEGILVSVFTCSLVVILACLPKFDSHLRMSLMNAFNLNIQKLSDLQSAWNQLFYWRRMRSWIIEKKIF
ncbi:transmembrane protein 71 isoform X2 [Mustela lutreola]|uniref:transmembrane protein 71 isoform X2 n=1 Tax=Mustela lutreola TaxID=9666 RepID=UPI0027972F2E|nr:transmembrane protein 71 isoform X2 [Mustela lutreola]XP_059021575.1 transmembrane protein 71 isoform X2 [Mustela lutreola]